MTKIEQQIKIAQSLGWTSIRSSRCYELTDNRDDQGRLIGQHHNMGWDFIPDYLHDLNAMRDAEASLRGDSEWAEYQKQLTNICGEWIWHASAEQRAQAFYNVLCLRHYNAAFK